MNISVGVSDKLYFKDEWETFWPYYIPGLKDEFSFRVGPDTTLATSLDLEIFYENPAKFRNTNLYLEVGYVHPINLRVTNLYLEIIHDYFSPWLVFEA